MSGSQDSRLYTVIATVGHGPPQQVQVQYTQTGVIGHGSFGVVYKAKLSGLSEPIAIKKVLQDKRYKNRELDIMKRLEHENVVKLLYYFYSTDENREQLFLNMMLEFLPETLYKSLRMFTKNKQNMPMINVKVYIYQLFRGIAYIHAEGFCHRDIKPHNLLVETSASVLKICDFGSAKQIVSGESNVSYICSRHYRAPELLFGATEYTNSIDTWSCGCILAECILGNPLFQGENAIEQLREIISILGTPSREEIQKMNPSYPDLQLPYVRPRPWPRVFQAPVPPQAVGILSKVLVFTSSARPAPLAVCAHEFFDDLRQENCRLPNGKDLPALFNFTEKELNINPELNSLLIPAYLNDKVVQTTDTENENSS